MDAVQRGHLDDEAATVLRRIAIAAPESASDDAARPGFPDGLRDGVEILGAQDLRDGRCSAAPAAQCSSIEEGSPVVACTEPTIAPESWFGPLSRKRTEFRWTDRCVDGAGVYPIDRQYAAGIAGSDPACVTRCCNRQDIAD